MEKLNNRILNNNYAPGIATYGIDGKDGDRGQDGTCFYFTTYNLEYGTSYDNEEGDVLVKINQNKILSGYVDRQNDRKYSVGDLIIDSKGYMYRIVKNQNNSFALQYISRLSIDDSGNFFQKIGNRVIITENGLDLVDSYDTDVLNSIESGSKYPLRVISTSKNSALNENGLLSLVVRPYSKNETEKFLNVYYDSETDSFCFESDSNIVFDTKSLMVKGTSENEPTFSDYYKVEPYNDPIGLLHKIYSSCSFGTEEGMLKVQGLYTDYSNIDIVPDFVKIRTKSNKEEMIVVDLGDYDGTDGTLSIELEYINPEEIVALSLIKGIEIYIKKG